MKKQLKQMVQVLVVCVMLFMSLTTNVYAITTITNDQGKDVTLPQFADMTYHWASETANKWYSYEIIKGVPTKIGKTKAYNFLPNDYITRRDMAVIINRLFDYETIATNIFNDLENGQYYTVPFLKVVAAEVVTTNNSYLRPHQYATRAETIDMLCKAFKLETRTGVTGFLDDYQIPDAQRASIYTMNKLGYVNGTPQGYLHPNSYVTRAEAITMIDNMIKGYYSGASTGTGAKYTDNYFGNGFINGKTVTLENSTITGNVYITNGSLKLVNSIITGVVICLDNKSTITLTDSKVGSIEIYGTNVNITGAEQTDSLWLHKATMTIVKGLPRYLTMETESKANINGTLFTNDTYLNKSYKKSDLIYEIAADQGKITDGPTIQTGSGTVTGTRKITVKNNKIKEGEYEIIETGIVLTKGKNTTPLYKDYDVIKEFDVDDVDLNNAFTITISNLKREEVYCYRAYVIDDEGNIGYGSIKTIKVDYEDED